jgi:hypothetical protein
MSLLERSTKKRPVDEIFKNSVARRAERALARVGTLENSKGYINQIITMERDAINEQILNPEYDSEAKKILEYLTIAAAALDANDAETLRTVFQTMIDVLSVKPATSSSEKKQNGPSYL